MRLFMATLSTETNTFSSMPTAMSAFEAYFLRYGDATSLPPNLMTEALHVWRCRAEALGWEVVESIAAIAEPAGRTTTACYEVLLDRLLSDLGEAGEVDIVLLQLHGAMVADGVDDCEGDITERIRSVLPNAVIGVSLDQHCHLTGQMLDMCDLIVCFKEYPHDDATPRAEELFDLAHRTALGQIKPVMAMFDCRMINLYLTKFGAMRGFVDYMTKVEQEPGLLSVSLAHGFPWGDVADVGARVLVIADDAPTLATRTAKELGREFYRLRDQVTCSPVGLDTALDEATSTAKGPVVLADMGDNSGGGAPGDSTYMLHAVLERKLCHVATGIYWDPMVVSFCEDAGEGATLCLRIGGKTEARSGTPVDVEATVMRIRSGLGQHLGAGLEPLGTLVWLKAANDVDILVNNLRTQVYHPEAFEQVGIDLRHKKIVTVKSLFHFYGPFEKLATRVIQVATPGGTTPDFTSIPFSKRDHRYWPKTSDPFEV
ncbi:MAG: M81 family metallopeptidase [Pseudomonadota bacterium]